MKNNVVATKDIYNESGQYLLDRTVHYLREGHKVFLQASGGSAISCLQTLAEWLNKYVEPLNDSLVISLIDERYNSDLYSKESNTMQINELIRVLINDSHEIGLIDLMENSGGVKGIYERVNHGLGKEHEVKEFEALLNKYLNDEDYVKIAIYGIGDDSHISGILPYPDNPSFFQFSFESTNLAVGYEVEDDRNPFKDRITTTFTAMKKVDEAIVIVSGDTKKSALEKALHGSKDQVINTPATILNQMKSVTIFSDCELNLPIN